nr:YaiO family outer membrane beta-barrel protein [Sinomicrobium weinanense]
MALEETRENRDYEKAIELCRKGLELSPDYIDIHLLLGRLYTLTGKPGEAENRFAYVLAEDPRHIPALKGLAALYTGQEKYTKAIALYDKLLDQDPDNQVYRFKKSGLLEAGGDYAAAAALSKQLMDTYKDSAKYRKVYIYQRLLQAKEQEKEGQWTEALETYKEVNSVSPVNTDALKGLAAIYTKRKEYSKAVTFYDKLLDQDPDNQVYLFKKSGLLEAGGNYAAAAALSQQLMDTYKDSAKYREVYVYQRLLQAKEQEKEEQWAEALATYGKVYEVSPGDTVALKGLVGGYNRKEQYDSVLKYSDKALNVYPENAWFLRQKTGTLEKMEHYKEAIASAKQYDALYPEEKRYAEYTGALRRKASKNQLGVIHLQSFFDNGTRTSNITSLQYMRYFQGGTTLTGRLNYANRQSGDGFQAELESYYMHSKKYYSYILAGWSDSEVFPQWRLGYSLYRNFNKGWEGELGMRYLRSEGINTYSGTWSVGKYFGNNWLNLRGYLIKDDDDWHQAYILTGRHYLNEKKDHIALILGTGTSPDDRNRNFQYNTLGSFISQSVGAGYQKTLGHLTTLSLYAVWNHQKIGDSRYLNQYDVYISLFRNF